MHHHLCVGRVSTHDARQQQYLYFCPLGILGGLPRVACEVRPCTIITLLIPAELPLAWFCPSVTTSGSHFGSARQALVRIRHLWGRGEESRSWLRWGRTGRGAARRWRRTTHQSQAGNGSQRRELINHRRLGERVVGMADPRAATSLLLTGNITDPIRAKWLRSHARAQGQAPDHAHVQAHVKP